MQVSSSVDDLDEVIQQYHAALDVFVRAPPSRQSFRPGRSGLAGGLGTPAGRLVAIQRWRAVGPRSLGELHCARPGHDLRGGAREGQRKRRPGDRLGPPNHHHLPARGRNMEGGTPPCRPHQHRQPPRATPDDVDPSKRRAREGRGGIPQRYVAPGRRGHQSPAEQPWCLGVAMCPTAGECASLIWPNLEG
jgi:hypothetical protein